MNTGKALIILAIILGPIYLVYRFNEGQHEAKALQETTLEAATRELQLTVEQFA